MSLWSWFLGSICTIVSEGVAHADAAVIQAVGESDEAWAKREAATRAVNHKRTLVLVHATVQVRTR